MNSDTERIITKDFLRQVLDVLPQKYEDAIKESRHECWGWAYDELLDIYKVDVNGMRGRIKAMIAKL